LASHPRLLRAAAKYMEVVHPSWVPRHIPSRFLDDLSEQMRSGKWEPIKLEDPKNPYLLTRLGTFSRRE